MKKSILALILVVVLPGCASLNQAVGAYGAVAIDNAKAANDTLIAGWTAAACATPVSAALRNPQIVPALRALCLPALEPLPSSLLDQIEAHQTHKAHAP